MLYSCSNSNSSKYWTFGESEKGTFGESENRTFGETDFQTLGEVWTSSSNFQVIQNGLWCHNLPRKLSSKLLCIRGSGTESKRKQRLSLPSKRVSFLKSTSSLSFSSPLTDLFTTRHKVVHNGWSPNFKRSLFDEKTTYMAQTLQSPSYKVYYIIISKFNTFGLFILFLGTSTIMDKTACCYNMTTSEIGLFWSLESGKTLY